MQYMIIVAGFLFMLYICQVIPLPDTKNNQVKSQIEESWDATDTMFLMKLDDQDINKVMKAVTFAEKNIGVQASDLLALLQVESYFGQNLGQGHWKRDMHPDQKHYFLDVCRKLNYDPNRVPVSKRKDTRSWGGAMGPSQMLPKTWASVEERVMEITQSNPPNPFDIYDACVGAALHLKDIGYDQNKKVAFARYYAGNNYRDHFWYANRVLRLSKNFKS